MWILKNSKNGVTYYLTTEKEHIVSRKDGDLILENDQSISRRHAVVSITYNSQHLADIKHQPEVAVMDTNSKYGTFVSDGTNELKKLTNNVKQTLQNGFCIRFGLQWNEWKLQHLPLIITTSTLTPDEKRAVQKDILTLGGHIVSNWIPDVTHVVMSKVTLTVKVVCALAYGKPIVTPQYWQSYVAAISSRKEPPDHREFLPPLAESTLNINEVSFDINENRRTLFSGKRVLFSTQRQFNSYACMVNAAGGRTEILDLHNHPNEYYYHPDCIVLQYGSDRRSQESQVPKEFEDLTRQLKERGKRVIPESEIALAVLFCSLEKHCNPEFNAATALVSSKVGINATGPNLLAMDTQESMPPSLNFETKIIPETGVLRTPSTPGKQSGDKDIEDSLSVFTQNVTSRRTEAGSSKQSQITDYIKRKKGDKLTLKASNSESKNVQGENTQKVPAMDNETVNVIKIEQMSPVPDNSFNRVENFTVSSSVTSKKRPGEENADIQCIAKKIKGGDIRESVDSSNLSKLNGKKTTESNKDSGASLVLGSENFTKIGKVVETQNKVLKQEDHDNCDTQLIPSGQQTPHGVKRRYAFSDDNDAHSVKRHSAANFDYSNHSTLPVEERLSAMSIKGVTSTDAQKKKTSVSTSNDAMDETIAAEEPVEEMTLIEFKELVVRKDNNTSVKNTFTEQLNSSIVNFKKFKKVRSMNRCSVPVELSGQYNNMDEAPEIENEFLDGPSKQKAKADDGWNGSGSGGGGGSGDGDDRIDGGNDSVDENEEDWFFRDSTWKSDQTRSVN